MSAFLYEVVLLYIYYYYCSVYVYICSLIERSPFGGYTSTPPERSLPVAIFM